MDAPSSFFFFLEKKEMERKQILHLKRINGTLTSAPKEMRMIAMDFYKELFGEQKCDVSSMDFLFKDLPKLNTEQQKELDSEITIHELSKAVQQLSIAKAPCIDGLPAEFYKHFWNMIKEDLLEVFNLLTSAPPYWESQLKMTN